MQRYLPVILGVLVIVGLTIPEYIMTDRLSGTNIGAEQRAALLAKVPTTVGDWRGEDMKIDDTTRETAGAVGAVSRSYRNVRTGERVDLWLIVGHARDISRHTPNICYRGAGFEAHSTEDSLYPMVMPDGTQYQFLTNKFFKEDRISGRRLLRVFWTWYNPDNDENQGKVVWEASRNARWRFGNTRGLYKMYFTSEMKDSMETTEQSACLRFAREFLPEVNMALAEVQLGATPGETAAPAVEATSDAPAVAPDEETPAMTASEPSAVAAPATTETPSATETPPVSTDPAKP